MGIPNSANGNGQKLLSGKDIFSSLITMGLLFFTLLIKDVVSPYEQKVTEVSTSLELTVVKLDKEWEQLDTRMKELMRAVEYLRDNTVTRQEFDIIIREHDRRFQALENPKRRADGTDRDLVARVDTFQPR